MNPTTTATVSLALGAFLAMAAAPAAAGIYETAAHCFDGGATDSNQGATAHTVCGRGVAEFGPPYRVGGSYAEVLVTASLNDGRFKQGVKADANAYLQTDGPDKVLGARGYVNVIDADWFSVQALGINDTAVSGGRLVVNLRLLGTLNLTTGAGAADSWARLSYNVQLENEAGEVQRASGNRRLDSAGVQAVNQTLTIPVAWQADGRIDFALSLLAETQASVSSTGSAKSAASFGHSLQWLGIDQVTDANGVPVASFRAVNPVTGVDWGVPSPVPEPAAWLLLAGALPLVVGRCRRLRAAGRGVGGRAPAAAA